MSHTSICLSSLPRQTEDQRTIRRLEEKLLPKDDMIAEFRHDLTRLRLRSTSEIDKTQICIKPTSEIGNLEASVDGLERQAALFRDQGNGLRSELSAKEETISSLKRECGILNSRNKMLERLNCGLKAEANQKSSKDIKRSECR